MAARLRTIELVQRAIRDSGLSSNEIARRCGMSPTQVSRLSRGERTCTLDTLDALGLGLGFKVVFEPAQARPYVQRRTTKPQK